MSTFRSKFSKREIVATALANAEKHHKSLNKKKTERKPKPVSEKINKVVETKQTNEAKKTDPVIPPAEGVAKVDPLNA